jgi:hypothetical protein
MPTRHQSSGSIPTGRDLSPEGGRTRGRHQRRQHQGRGERYPAFPHRPRRSDARGQCARRNRCPAPWRSRSHPGLEQRRRAQTKTPGQWDGRESTVGGCGGSQPPISNKSHRFFHGGNPRQLRFSPSPPFARGAAAGACGPNQSRWGNEFLPPICAERCSENRGRTR